MHDILDYLQTTQIDNQLAYKDIDWGTTYHMPAGVLEIEYIRFNHRDWHFEVTSPACDPSGRYNLRAWPTASQIEAQEDGVIVAVYNMLYDDWRDVIRDLEYGNYALPGEIAANF